MLIVVEGVDGCGKTSVVEALAKHLSCQSLSFPDDTAVTGPLIRSYLRREWGAGEITERGISARDAARVDPKMGALVFQALQVTNRMERMTLLEAAAQHPTNHIVCARYWPSAWVYGQLDGLDPKFLVDIHESMAQPDLNLLLSVSPKIAMARRALRDGEKPPERYEADLAKLIQASDLYHRLWDLRSNESFTDKFCWRVIDVNLPIDLVVSRAVDLSNAVAQRLQINALQP